MDNDTISMKLSILYLKGFDSQNFYKMMHLCSWRFIWANSADPNKMPPYVAFHQGLFYLLK